MKRSFSAMLVVGIAATALGSEPHAASQAVNQRALNLRPHLVSAAGALTDWNQVSTPTAAGTRQQNSARAGDTVTFWNATGIDTVLATPLGPRGAPLGSRAMAMMHVAMADAVTSIHPIYKPYAIRIRGHRNANEIAAAASAAYGVLVRLFPARQAQLDAALAESLAPVRDGKKKEQGMALGDEVAAQIVALRANDGSSDGLPYTPPVGLGFWQPDPRTGASPFLS